MITHSKTQLYSTIQRIDRLTQQLLDQILIKPHLKVNDEINEIKDTHFYGHHLFHPNFITIAMQLSSAIKQLIAIQPVLLCPQQYVNLCELIITANEMADYLDNKRAPNWVRRHAISGKFLIKQFETLLIEGRKFYSAPVIINTDPD